MKNSVWVVLMSGALMASCAAPTETEQENIPATIEEVDVNPAAEGFNLENSDPEAIALADAVMEAMGGRANWDDTHYLSWNFLGYRQHYWNKHTGDVRIESLHSDFNVLMNIYTMEGKVVMDSVEITHPDSLVKYLDIGKQMWVNDSYWLVMPFKLKDSGVTLTHVGQHQLTDSTNTICDVLELTFNAVGYTPENKYWVYIDPEDQLVKQWDFYSTVQQDSADISSPWRDYQQHGSILLAHDRGRFNLTNITVHDTLPPSVFESFQPVELHE